MALCRLNQIPARIITGRFLDDWGLTDLHNWVEVYIPSKGWVSFDPYLYDATIQLADYDRLLNRYVRYSYNGHIGDNNWDKLYNDDWNHLKFDLGWNYEMYPLFENMLQYYNQHDYKKALTQLKEMTKLDPLYFRIYEFTGMIQARQGNFEYALKNLNYALKLAYTDLEKETVEYGIASYHALKGERKEAIKKLKAIKNLCTCSKKRLLNDEDLRSLHGMTDFEELIESI